MLTAADCSARIPRDSDDDVEHTDVDEEESADELNALASLPPAYAAADSPPPSKPQQQAVAPTPPRAPKQTTLKFPKAAKPAQPKPKRKRRADDDSEDDPDDHGSDLDDFIVDGELC